MSTSSNRPTATAGERRTVLAVVTAAAATRLRRFLCGLRGHDALLHYEGTRIMLRCSSCGHDTPGWNVPLGKRRSEFPGDPKRHDITPRPHLLKRSA